MYIFFGDIMKRSKKKLKRIILFITIIISMIYSYKYLDNKNIEIDNKEVVEMVINNTFKQNSILDKMLSFNKENQILLLKESFDNVVSEKPSGNPIIYIYNSHPTERYMHSNIGEFSIDPTVIMNNYILEDIFNKKGYLTLVEEGSVTEILNNNNWNYASSYKASRILMETAKKNNPSLEYFIDVHRDSLSKDKTTITIEDKDYAKMIFLLGLENPKYEDNLVFMERINNKIDSYYPGLSKGIYKKGGAGVNGVYNQDFSSKTILIEVGGEENTTTEVLNSAIAFSRCFLEVLDEESN